jgi:hypothetical protein
MQVKIRGESMQAAADAAESGMVSIIGLGPEKVQDICTAANEKLGSQAVQIANYLCSGNYVISGSKEVCPYYCADFDWNGYYYEKMASMCDTLTLCNKT